jgi:hypothetical protein
MNHYVTLALTSRKSSVHLHALYFPRTVLRMFTPRRDHLMVCLLYSIKQMSKEHLASTYVVTRCQYYRLVSVLAFWVVSLCGFVGRCQRFGRTSCLHFHGWRVSYNFLRWVQYLQASTKYKIATNTYIRAYGKQEISVEIWLESLKGKDYS